MNLSPNYRQGFIAITTFLASLSIGATIGYPSVLLLQLRRNDTSIQIDMDSASWIGSIHGLAGILSIVMPTIMQWKGRKLAFIVSCIPVIIGWMLIYFANSVSTILISECLQGFGANSLFNASFLILSEMIAPKYRNVYVQSYSIVQALGIALVGTLIKTLHWRLISIVFVVPIILAVLLAVMWPESPFWLAVIGNVEKCEETFIWLRGKDEKSLRELEELLASQNNSKRNNKVGIFKKTCRDICNSDFYMPAFHIFLLFSIVYCSGHGVILIYGVQLILTTTNNETAAYYGGVSLTFILLAGVTISAVMIKHFKNKHVLLISALGAFLSLLSVSIVTGLQSLELLSKDSNLGLYAFISFMVTASLGMIPGAFTVTAELMPVKYRGTGGCVSMLCTCILHAFTLKTAPYLFSYIGLSGTFFLYTLNVVFCALLIWRYVPETKGRTLVEIENFYMYGAFIGRTTTSEREHIIISNASS